MGTPTPTSRGPRSMLLTRPPRPVVRPNLVMKCTFRLRGLFRVEPDRTRDRQALKQNLRQWAWTHRSILPSLSRRSRETVTPFLPIRQKRRRRLLWNHKRHQDWLALHME